MKKLKKILIATLKTLAILILGLLALAFGHWLSKITWLTYTIGGLLTIFVVVSSFNHFYNKQK